MPTHPSRHPHTSLGCVLRTLLLVICKQPGKSLQRRCDPSSKRAYVHGIQNPDEPETEPWFTCRLGQVSSDAGKQARTHPCLLSVPGSAAGSSSRLKVSRRGPTRRWCSNDAVDPISRPSIACCLHVLLLCDELKIRRSQITSLA